MTAAADGVTQVTELYGDSATWYVRGGVIHVLRIRRDGVETVHHDAPPLGKCFDLMPRPLWERIRYEYQGRWSWQ